VDSLKKHLPHINSVSKQVSASQKLELFDAKIMPECRKILREFIPVL
jgi:hypothetical protein